MRHRKSKSFYLKRGCVFPYETIDLGSQAVGGLLDKISPLCQSDTVNVEMYSKQEPRVRTACPSEELRPVIRCKVGEDGWSKDSVPGMLPRSLLRSKRPDHTPALLLLHMHNTSTTLHPHMASPPPETRMNTIAQKSRRMKKTKSLNQCIPHHSNQVPLSHPAPIPSTLRIAASIDTHACAPIATFSSPHQGASPPRLESNIRDASHSSTPR